jgi:GNAT superfamily N-acetyltransferase
MNDLDISFDLARIDFRKTSDLIKASYWGMERNDDLHRRAFENSFFAAAFVDGEQVAFARVITDRAVFAYFADVIVWPEHRGRGIGKRLIRALLDHSELATVSHFSLTTTDAHELYAKFGFVREGRYMRMER